MRAEIEIECTDPELIIRSVEPDVSPTEKFSAKMEAGKGVLRISIESKDLSGLLAGINSYTRLAKVALDVKNLEE